MTRDEIKTILAMIQSVFQNWKVNQALVDTWFAILGKYDKDLVLRAVQGYLSTDAKFAPTPGEINKICEKEGLPDSIRLTALEAMSSNCPLAQDASVFADRQSYLDPKTQYSSIEEMHRAQAIAKATWRRAFTERFETLQERAKHQILLGRSAKEAILYVLDKPALTPRKGVSDEAMLNLVNFGSFVPVSLGKTTFQEQTKVLIKGV